MHVFIHISKCVASSSGSVLFSIQRSPWFVVYSSLLLQSSCCMDFFFPSLYLYFLKVETYWSKRLFFSASSLFNEHFIKGWRTNGSELQQPTYNPWTGSHLNCLSCLSSGSALSQLSNWLYRIRKKKLKVQWTANFPFKNIATEATKISILIPSCCFLFYPRDHWSVALALNNSVITPVGICNLILSMHRGDLQVQSRKTGKSDKREKRRRRDNEEPTVPCDGFNSCFLIVWRVWPSIM